jgi:putative SOS response-associated peptidase YedK
MCGRFTLTRRDGREIAEMLGIDPREFRDHLPRYNVAPTQHHYLVSTEYENRRVTLAKWGLINSWARDASRAAQQINAKAETIDSRGAFKEAFRERRCVIPADGFYEWTGPKTRRVPLWIHRPDDGLILFAGLYESWYPERGRPELTFTIVTSAANATLAPVHDRMPVILSDRDADDWMNPREPNPSTLKRLLVPTADDVLVMTPASPLANNAKNEGPELLDALGGLFSQSRR